MTDITNQLHAMRKRHGDTPLGNRFRSDGEFCHIVEPSGMLARYYQMPSEMAHRNSTTAVTMTKGDAHQR